MIFGKPTRITIHNPDPKLVDELLAKYGKPRSFSWIGDEVIIEW